MRLAPFACLIPCVLAAGCAAPSPGGLFTGTLTSTAAGATYSVVGMVDEDGLLQLINTTNAGQYSGQLTVHDTELQKISNTGKLTGTLTAFDATGTASDTGTLTGSLTGRTQAGGTLTLAGGDTGTLALTYSTLYAAPATLATAAGSYTWTSARNSGTSSLTFSGAGVLTGTTEYGCAFTGSASVPNAIYNLFSIALTLETSTACGAGTGGTLTGLAYFTPASGSTPATLTLAATNSAYGTFAVYQRAS